MCVCVFGGGMTNNVGLTFSVGGTIPQFINIIFSVASFHPQWMSWH